MRDGSHKKDGKKERSARFEAGCMLWTEPKRMNG